MIGWIVAAPISGFAGLVPGRLGKFLAPLLPYLTRPLVILPAVALSLILQASLATCQYLLALGLGLNMSLAAFMLCVPMVNVLASLPVTLNGLGLREAGYLVLLGVAGASKTDAIGLGLLWFATTMLGGMTGAVPFVMTKVPSLQRAPAET